MVRLPYIYTSLSSILYLISYFIFFYLLFLTCDALYNIHFRHSVRLSGKYAAIFNISRTGLVTLMSLGSQSDETLLRIREKPLSRETSQSAVRSR